MNNQPLPKPTQIYKSSDSGVDKNNVSSASGLNSTQASKPVGQTSNLGTVSKPANVATNPGNAPKPNPLGLSANKAPVVQANSGNRTQEPSKLPPAPGKPNPTSSTSPAGQTNASTPPANPTAPLKPLVSSTPPANPTAPLRPQISSNPSVSPGSSSPASSNQAGTKNPISEPTKANLVDGGDKNSSRVPLSQKPSSIQQPVVSNTRIQFPPTSLSALSSMSSSTIPKNTVMPERTVLGSPIPQTIRGEQIPVGLNVDSSRLKPELQPSFNVQTSNSGMTSPVPVSPNQGSNNSLPPAANYSDNNEKPVIAKQTNSIARFIPLIIGVIALMAVIVFAAITFLGGSKTNPLPGQPNGDGTNNSVPNNDGSNNGGRVEVPAEQKNVVYWGLWEPNEVVEQIISDFETANPGIKVTYLKQSHKDYRERLQTALDSGSGPDIFRFHASWVPMLNNNLYPIPSSVVSSKEFQDNYYPVVNDQLVINGQHVGVPLMYDGLALYYNEEIFESANVSPPSTWAELSLLASKLTVKSATGIERAGLAIGNTSNVEHFSDILAVLMLQNGADFNEPNSQETKDALLFYTNFVLKHKVWDESMPSSTVAFARGDVAMMFAPSWRAHEINAQNPNLRYKTMTLPQLSDERITWGSYWAEGINSSSKYKDETSLFLTYLNSDENLKKLFSKASEVRAFGEIYPKVSMAEQLINNKVIAAFLDDAVYSRSWYLNSYTHDNGINDQLIEYYRDGVNAILEGGKIEDVLETIDAGTKDILKQYGVTKE